MHYLLFNFFVVINRLETEEGLCVLVKVNMMLLRMKAFFLICLVFLLRVQARPLQGNIHVSAPNFAALLAHIQIYIVILISLKCKTILYHCLCAAISFKSVKSV